MRSWEYDDYEDLIMKDGVWKYFDLYIYIFVRYIYIFIYDFMILWFYIYCLKFLLFKIIYIYIEFFKWKDKINDFIIIF